MKKLFIVIFLIGLMTSLVFVMKELTDKKIDNVKDTNNNIETTSKEIERQNAYTYIKSVNESLISSLFDGDIVDGTYKVNGEEIVNVLNNNIYYEISYSGEKPSNESTLDIENNEVASATIYMKNEKIEYKK